VKKGKVFYHPIDGSSPLSISWISGPKGDAVEAKNGLGVGFFSKSGDLLSVIFDDVSENEDHQILEFDRYQVEIKIVKGSVIFKVETKEIKTVKKIARKSRTARKRSLSSQRKRSVK
jgi:hypothetical protein